MPDPAVGTLLYLLDESFEQNDEHSLLGNLRNVTDGSWSKLPPQGSRSIRQIADHAGVAIYPYGDHLFGNATLTYLEVLKLSPATDDESSIPAVAEWLRTGHAIFRDGLAGMTEADLLAQRRSHWGQMAEARWLIGIVIQHNVYHAGEINHARALLQQDDGWPRQR